MRSRKIIVKYIGEGADKVIYCKADRVMLLFWLASRPQSITITNASRSSKRSADFVRIFPINHPHTPMCWYYVFVLGSESWLNCELPVMYLAVLIKLIWCPTRRGPRTSCLESESHFVTILVTRMRATLKYTTTTITKVQYWDREVQSWSLTKRATGLPDSLRYVQARISEQPCAKH